MMKAITRTLATAALAATLLSPVALANGLPFEISVDGKRVEGTQLPPAVGAGGSSAEAQGEAQGKLDIQVKYDGLGVGPTLNVSTLPPQASFSPGDDIKFQLSLNYPSYIQKAEVRIYESGTNKVVTTLPVGGDGFAEWIMTNDAPDELDYVLRVYDFDGRYDETRARTILKSGVERSDRAAAPSPGSGEDFTAVRNIDVSGGAVTIYGKNVPADHDVRVMGEPVATDGNGGFVLQRIMPAGAQQVNVAIKKDGEGLDFTRDVEIPANEWFYVGLADLTVGHNFKKEIAATSPDEFDGTWSRGRLAFYLKGKIKGQYILTASADTSDQKLKHIFKGLDEKDPREFLRRIDPQEYYPVYGDDSTSVDDAPTQGKFYVRLERGPSHVMWGNFKSSITGTKFLRNERALYGAQGVYRSRGTAPNGEANTALDAYAALPGTVPQRDILRATGGSAYFLKHRDITQGSETVTVEHRNPTTGWVVATETLKFGEDYSIDNSQGVIILRQPLASTDAANRQQFLVVNYEYTPAASDVKGYATGGRAQQWLGDHLRVGVTAQKEKTTGADQKMVGADVHVEATPNTYIEAEVARSKGPGFGNTYSPDGGLTTQNNPTAGVAGKGANAWRVEAQVDMADVSDGAEGKIAARVEKFEKGFASLDTQATEKKFSWGVEADTKLSDRVKVAATYSDSKTGDGRIDRAGEAKTEIALTEHVSIEPYAAYEQRKRATASTEKQGKRLDAGARLKYKWDEDNEAYVFGHATTLHTGTLGKNHRAGFGIKKQFTDRVGFEGEVSHGTTGVGASALFSYEPTAESRYYLGYTLDADRAGSGSWPFQLVGSDMGTVVAGTSVKLNDQWTMFGEDTADFFGHRRSLTQAYGVTYTPNDLWTYSGSLEFGNVYDSIAPKNDVKRFAISNGVTYRDEKTEAKVKTEYRRDNSAEANKDLDSWLLQSAISTKASDDWRMLASFDLVYTDADEAAREGKLAEGTFGFAYRPVDSDKLNALVKYTFLFDNPGAGQVTVDQTLDAASQRSHIFNADVSYDIDPRITIGAKYGFRIGDIKERVPGAAWTSSQAHLGILRADWHIVHQWDAVAEGRLLWSPTTDTQEFGFLIAVYKHLNDNFKLGVGYNFGRFSDDLRDLSLNDAGVFVNIVGTF
jgi:hypothetical protein